METIRRIRSPVLCVALLLLAWGCGSPPDPVVEMQKTLTSAPEYTILLEDMQEEGTIFTRYAHRYKVVQGDKTRVTDWIEVPESVYRKYEPFLGMALASKTGEGVNATPHPAGYDYVGNPQYGRWVDRGGTSFWEFYGQYAMLQALLGGGGRTIFRNDYDDYRTSRDRGRPYYGPNREYGTEGSVTRQQRPSFFERRRQAIANRQSAFSRKVQGRIGRSRTGFGSRGGGFGK